MSLATELTIYNTLGGQLQKGTKFSIMLLIDYLTGIKFSTFILLNSIIIINWIMIVEMIIIVTLSINILKRIIRW